MYKQLRFVYVIDSTVRVPVFHHPAGSLVEESITYGVTRCHRQVLAFDAVLRRDHAELFCRPCKPCYYGDEVSQARVPGALGGPSKDDMGAFRPTPGLR